MSPSLSETDVRTVPPPARHPEILESFDALSPGMSLILERDHYPRPLLRELQAERPGAFEWNVLEMGPQRFRVELRRRSSPGPRAVTECLEADHRRLDEMLRHVVELADTCRFPEASARFAEFSCGLDRHIEIEEQLLFPAFARLTGITEGPIVVMRTEHAEIRTLLSDVTGALAARDSRNAHAAIDALVQVLSLHNMKEERVLYPMTDRAAGDASGQNELVERLQAF